MSVAELPQEAVAQSPLSAQLYRAIWRWHFYAGLMVLPFLVTLAVTGSLYLFKDEINAVVYARELHVTPRDTQTLKPSEIVKRAEAAFPGSIFRYAPPEASDRSAEVGIESATHGPMSVFVDPYTGEITGSFADSGSSRTPLMQFLKALFDGGFKQLGAIGKAIEFGISVHQGQEFGRINQLIMLGACLAIILMAVSAVVMWWKRRPKGALGAPRYPQDYRIPRTVLVIACIFGLVFPLVGLTLVTALAVDLILPGRREERIT